jgi:hypothetical protein
MGCLKIQVRNREAPSRTPKTYALLTGGDACSPDGAKRNPGLQPRYAATKKRHGLPGRAQLASFNFANKLIHPSVAQLASFNFANKLIHPSVSND